MNSTFNQIHPSVTDQMETGRIIQMHGLHKRPKQSNLYYKIKSILQQLLKNVHRLGLGVTKTVAKVYSEAFLR